jgi:hypothetical protein
MMYALVFVVGIAVGALLILLFAYLLFDPNGVKRG